jgi:hypothetical protein
VTMMGGGLNLPAGMTLKQWRVQDDLEKAELVRAVMGYLMACAVGLIAAVFFFIA